MYLEHSTLEDKFAEWQLDNLEADNKWAWPYYWAGSRQVEHSDYGKQLEQPQLSWQT